MSKIQKWEEFNENLSYDLLEEKILSELQKEYRAYFKEMLKIYDVNSPAKLSKEMKKEFFKNIRKNWVKGSGPKFMGEELIDAVDKK